jgi:hypothetical protein
MEKLVQKRVRKYGVDILKIVAMNMVNILHVLGQGKVLSNTETNSLNFYIANYIETAAYCSVNAYAIVSGYLIITSKCNHLKIIPLWLTVAFYSGIIKALFTFVPQLYELNPTEKSIKSLLKFFLAPASSNVYWYVTAYFGMYFFIPYMNRVLLTLSEKEYRKLIITIIILFTCLPLVNLHTKDIFHINNGNSIWWLGCLYVIGGYFKLYPIKMSKILSLVMFFVSVTIAWSSIFIKSINLIRHDSIFIVFSGLFLFLFFYDIKVTNTTLQKLLVIGSSTSFSVYLIHVHPIIFKLLLNRYSSYSRNPSYLLVLKVLGTALAIYLVCTSIDFFRYYLFKFLRVDSIPRVIEEKFLKEKEIKEDRDDKENLINKESNEEEENNDEIEEEGKDITTKREFSNGELLELRIVP